MSDEQQISSSQSNIATYVAGEDSNRLASAAHYFGLDKARKPLKPVRDAVGKLFADSTLASARMHSVGILGKDERVDEGGTLHLMTVQRRRRGKATSEYGTLMDLFHKQQQPQPLQYEQVAVEEEEEGEEFEEVVVDTVGGGSLTAAAFGIIKGTVGPAILYLPRGFRLSGYAAAIICCILATVSFLYSARRLLECWKVEKERSELLAARMEEIKALWTSSDSTPAGQEARAVNRTNYGSVQNEIGREESSKSDKEKGRHDFLTLEQEKVEDKSGAITTKLLNYPELARRAFGKGAFVVELGIALMQFGVCLTYLIFVPQNLYETARALFGVTVPKIYFLILMIAIEIPLSWIRDIRKLTPTNILATLLIAYGLASCLIIALLGRVIPSVQSSDFVDDSSLFQKIVRLPPWVDTWYLFIGTSFFAFEGSITLVVPLQEAVFRKEDKDKFPDLNQVVTSWIVVFYVFFAITCWSAFGDSVKTALTACLPEGLFAISVQLAYSIAVIFTFPLQAFPALEVVCHTQERKAGKSGNDSAILKRNITASLLICLLGVIAVLAIDYLGNVVSLLGSLVGIPIALIYPPLMHNELVKNSPGRIQLMNLCVAGLGFVAMGVTSFTTIVEWDKGAEG